MANPNWNCFYNLGNALSRTGRVQKAIDHYEQALLVNPHDSDARVNLAKLQAGQTTTSGTR